MYARQPHAGSILPHIMHACSQNSTNNHKEIFCEGSGASGICMATWQGGCGRGNTLSLAKRRILQSLTPKILRHLEENINVRNSLEASRNLCSGS